MAEVVVSLVGGASLGGTYALIGLGLVLVFRATGTFNFAHGELMVLPALMLGTWQEHNAVPTPLAIILALATVAVVGALFFVLVLDRTTGLPHFTGVIATLGLATVADGIIGIIYGSKEYNITLPALPTGSTHILGAGLSTSSLVLTVFTILLATTVAIVLRFTHLGTKIRAAGQDPALASHGGINVRRLYIGSWAIAAVLAGVAGICYGAGNLVNVSIVNLALAAFPAILLGGLDSVEGAIVGGILVGILQGFVATYFGSKVLDVTTYGLLLFVLLVYPSGLFGTKQIARV